MDGFLLTKSQSVLSSAGAGNQSSVLLNKVIIEVVGSHSKVLFYPNANFNLSKVAIAFILFRIEIKELCSHILGVNLKSFFSLCCGRLKLPLPLVL